MNAHNFFRKKNECGEVRIIKKLLIILSYYVDLGKFVIDDHTKLVPRESFNDCTQCCYMLYSIQPKKFSNQPALEKLKRHEHVSILTEKKNEIFVRRFISNLPRIKFLLQNIVPSIFHC